jgi:hypothetical protein
MKKILLAAALSSSFVFGFAPYSSEVEDGINPAFQEYDQFIQQENEKIKQRYQELKRTTIKEILDNQKIKEKHLRHITKMNIDSTTDKNNINFEFERFKQMKNKQGDE